MPKETALHTLLEMFPDLIPQARQLATQLLTPDLTGGEPQSVALLSLGMVQAAHELFLKKREQQADQDIQAASFLLCGVVALFVQERDEQQKQTLHAQLSDFLQLAKADNLFRDRFSLTQILAFLE